MALALSLRHLHSPSPSRMFKTCIGKSSNIITPTKVYYSSSPSSSSGKDTLIYSWGDGVQGQLGHAKFTTTYDYGSHKNVYIQKEPRKMLKSKRFKKLAVGDGFTLGICSQTNSLYGWGEGPLIGRKEATPDPVLLPIPSSVKDIIGVYASSHHAAILDANGHVYTWGQNCDPKGMISSLKQGGQLGHGNRDYYEKPTLIESLANDNIKAVSLALGNQHTLITTDSGKVYSCGAGEYGRLGTGNTSDCLIPSVIETFVTEGEKIIQCAAGTNHSIALTESGALYSWGRNETGQLGHFDTYVDHFSLEDYPKRILSEAMEGLKVRQVAAAKGRSAAVTECGKLFIWGAKLNHYPALIDPSFFNNQKVVKVSCGGVIGMSVTSVITEDGALWTFGDSSSRMLGQPDASSSYVVFFTGRQGTPLQVPLFKDKYRVLDVFCGFGQHCAALVGARE